MLASMLNSFTKKPPMRFASGAFGLSSYPLVKRVLLNMFVLPTFADWYWHKVHLVGKVTILNIINCISIFHGLMIGLQLSVYNDTLRWLTEVFFGCHPASGIEETVTFVG